MNAARRAELVMRDGMRIVFSGDDESLRSLAGVYMANVYVVTQWDFNESAVLGVALSVEGAQAIAQKTMEAEDAAHGGQPSGPLNWLPPAYPDHQHCVIWANAVRHTSYDIDEYDLQP